MSVLLQSMKTEKYVNEAEGWTPLSAQAKDFPGANEALRYCFQHHLAHMKILGLFVDSRMDFSISLNNKKTSGGIAE